MFPLARICEDFGLTPRGGPPRASGGRDRVSLGAEP